MFLMQQGQEPSDRNGTQQPATAIDDSHPRHDVQPREARLSLPHLQGGLRLEGSLRVRPSRSVPSPGAVARSNLADQCSLIINKIDMAHLVPCMVSKRRDHLSNCAVSVAPGMSRVIRSAAVAIPLLLVDLY